MAARRLRGEPVTRLSPFSRFPPVQISRGERDASLAEILRQFRAAFEALISTAKLYEVQKYCSLTNHMWDGFWMLGNADAMKALPKNLQDILHENLNQAAIDQRADLQTV